MTIRFHHSWVFAAIALIALCAGFTVSSAVYASSPVRSGAPPDGWHLLYNMGQGKCLNLMRGTTLQRCDPRDESQQYAALQMSDGGLLLVNRQTAQCLAATGIRTITQDACTNEHRRGETMIWGWQWLGGSPPNYHLLSDGRALTYRSSGTGGLGMTFSRPNNSDLNQAWQFR